MTSEEIREQKMLEIWNNTPCSKRAVSIKKTIKNYNRLTPQDFLDFCGQLDFFFGTKNFTDKDTRQYILAAQIYKTAQNKDFSRQEFISTFTDFRNNYTYGMNNLKEADFFSHCKGTSSKYDIEYEKHIMHNGRMVKLENLIQLWLKKPHKRFFSIKLQNISATRQKTNTA